MIEECTLFFAREAWCWSIQSSGKSRIQVGRTNMSGPFTSSSCMASSDAAGASAKVGK
jgi:hypothetical protein